MNLKSFFSPKSIAIVGASPKKEKLGYVLAKNIRDAGWKGKLYFVNPKHARIDGEKCYKNLSALKKPIDLALIAIPAPYVNEILLDGAKAKSAIRNFVVISAGFKETGKAGKRLEENLLEISKEQKLNVLGPNCLGFINSSEKLNATFTSAKIIKGKIAIVSQSGAMAVALLDWAQMNDVGFSKVISIGNKTIIDEAELIKYLDQDKETSAIALYLEDIKDGMSFISAVTRANCRKPIAVIKAGKSKAGQHAVSSHTGSLAQDDKIIEAIFEKFGIIEAASVEHFEDIITQLEYNDIPRLRETIVLTNAGGPGVLAADFVGKSKELTLLRMPNNIKKELRKILPASAAIENPIDMLGDAPPERYKQTLQILSKYFRKNPIIVLLTPQNQTDPENVAKIIGTFRKKFSSLSTSFMGGAKIVKAHKHLEIAMIPDYESPERALASLEGAEKYNQCLGNKLLESVGRPIKLKLKTNKITEEAMTQKRSMLSWQEADNVCRDYGINLAKSHSVSKISDIDAKHLQFPVVLKADDPGIAHRWEKKAVELDIKNFSALKLAFKKLKRRIHAKKYIVQSMQEKGLEIIAGMKRDPSFGPVVIVGSGGTFTEIWKDNIVLIPPFSPGEIKKKLEKLAIYPVLKGFRGEKAYRVDEIIKIALALQDIAVQNPNISEIDINPAILYNNSRTYSIVDAKIFLR